MCLEIIPANECQTETALDRAMRLYAAQSVLFSPKVSRLALSRLQTASAADRDLRVNVWRNHAIEPLIPLLMPYCAFQAWQPDIRVGGYDDTLLFSGRHEADVELLWLDSGRFLAHTSFSDWSQWLATRIRTLRSETSAPIILATWCEGPEQNEGLQTLADSIPAMYFADLGAACIEADVALLDLRSAAVAGTPISKAAQLVLARKLACHWLPASVLPPVKAVILDLDQTLHLGVLGEDGAQGVQLTPGHTALQQHLKDLQQRGIFLALVSRNEQADVEALFAGRPDYPLRWEDFSATEVSWGDKAAAIERIAKTLRIAPDAMLFVDDNPGELANVAMQLPSIHTVLAHPDAGLTRSVVRFYPGLWRWKVESDDTRRIDDLKANRMREALAGDLTTAEDYFRSLQVTLSYRYNPVDQLNRLADLCNKTNQFNLALRRFNTVEVADRLNREDACVASVQLTDRFADSGVIAILIAQRNGIQLVVEELCISCRALGRQLESTIILLALRDMPVFANCREVAFRVQRGPRNQPALEWLARFLDRSDVPEGLHAVPAQRLLDFVAMQGININKE